MTQHETLDNAALMEIASRWLQALTDGSREIVTLLDHDGRVRFMSISTSVQRLLGYDALRLARARDLELIHPDDRDRLVDAFKKLVAEDGARQSIEYRVRHAAGNYVAVQSTAVNRLNDPVVASVVVHSREARRRRPSGSWSVSDDQRVRERRGFIDAVEQCVDRSRMESDYGFSVLMLELDRHKMLVGSFGHELVDELMGEVSKRLLSLMRPQDILGMMGGGEFALLLDGVKDRRQAARVADRIQRTVAARFTVNGRDIKTGAIVGIATSERAYERAEDVVRDAALAANRARGGGSRQRRAVFQTQMRVEDSRVLSMVSALHGALQENQLRLRYQPIVSLGTRALVGFEALVRWQHPEQGLILPDQFIPIAEESGMIIQLGQWVLREACRQMVAWNAEYSDTSPLSISVNLSAKQIAEEDLSKQVERILAETGFDARQLKLEVTETAVLENRETATTTLERLKQQGVKVSLDDFGTGYSSFSYLHQLPYDTLKIDRSFVSRIGQDGETSEIIHAIIVLAHNLRMDVVAEGVETAAQAAQLNTMWCEYGQGYYFAKPVDAAEAGAMIATPPRW